MSATTVAETLNPRSRKEAEQQQLHLSEVPESWAGWASPSSSTTTVGTVLSALAPLAAAALPPSSASSTGTTVKFMGMLAAGFQCSSRVQKAPPFLGLVRLLVPQEEPPSSCSGGTKSDFTSFNRRATLAQGDAPVPPQRPPVVPPSTPPSRSDQVLSRTPLECGNTNRNQPLKLCASVRSVCPVVVGGVCTDGVQSPSVLLRGTGPSLSSSFLLFPAGK